MREKRERGGRERMRVSEREERGGESEREQGGEKDKIFLETKSGEKTSLTGDNGILCLSNGS